ncbi:hypothetical protein [Alteromonas facilis]|uniref:hypothetical protein n=1 Tax=Alteromonas facilis TaxID=2048004 RepID=UPI000C284305|nr:hypothetical protein [Alteromonas facilis]
MTTNNTINKVILTHEQLAQLELISGTSGRAVRWLVGGFTLSFGALLYWLVIAKPEVPFVIKVISSSLFAIAILALIISGRLKRGWPNILHDNDYLYVVYDPAKSEFLSIPFELISNCTKKMLYPNTMAVSIELVADKLSDDCQQLLKSAIFPAENAVHIYSALNSRNNIILRVKALIQKSASAD